MGEITRERKLKRLKNENKKNEMLNSTTDKDIFLN